MLAGAVLVAPLRPALAARADSDGEVAVGGEHILTVRFAAGGMSVRQRADAITDRLVTILSDPDLRPADIQALPLNSRAAVIRVKRNLLVTIEQPDATFNHTTALALAQVWVRHLRKVLPKVNVKPPRTADPIRP